MIWLRSCLVFFFLLVFASAAQAGKDPIGWSVTNTFPGQTTVNELYGPSVYTFINNLPFTMPTPLFIAKNTSSNEFSIKDHCSGLRLNSNQSCTVEITLFPTSGGNKSVSLEEQYGANVVPLPQQTTNANNSSGQLITGKVIIALPANIGTGELRPVAFQFSNNGTGAVENVSYHPHYPPGFTETSNTCNPPSNSQIRPGKNCRVTGNLIAATPGNFTVAATLNYTGGSTSVSTSTTASQLVTGAATPSLPANSGAGIATQVGFTFTNGGTVAVQDPINATAAVTTGGSTGTFTVAGTNTCTTFPSCSGTTLAAGASCTLCGTLNTTATGNYTVTGTFTYAGPNVTVATSTNAGRQLTVINNCSSNVWWSFNGSATGGSCATSSDCPAGSSCGNGQCFWTNPSPVSGSFQLGPAGSGTNIATLVIPDVNSSTSTTWSGTFAGRTGCSGTSCATANCNTTGGNSACDPGTSFSLPATIVELTLMRNNVDTYDVSLVNGITVATSMQPTTVTGPVGSPYVCGSPGSGQNNGEPACSWIFTPNPTPASGTGNYIWTQFISGAPCTNATAFICPVINPSYVCGLSFNPAASVGSKITQTCGPQLGYWTADQACITDNGSANNFFNCNTPLTGPLTGFTLLNLYACVPATPGGNLGSCYDAIHGATPNCCGCQNWDQAPTSIPGMPPATGSPQTQACITSNPQWTDGTFTGEVLGTVDWIKAGCPSAKVYPFDTASSTFTCPATAPTNNTTRYTMIFCPT